MTEKLYPHTFKDTGRVVRIRKVGPMLVAKLQQQNPPPKPPLVEVDYSGEKRLEANEASPEYQAALQKYGVDLNIKVAQLYIDRGVVVELGEAEKQEVADFRTFWEAQFNEPLAASDKAVYVQYICIGTDDELGELVEAITRRSQPTEAAVAEAVAGFQPDVQG